MVCICTCAHVIILTSSSPAIFIAFRLSPSSATLSSTGMYVYREMTGTKADTCNHTEEILHHSHPRGLAPNRNIALEVELHSLIYACKHKRERKRNEKIAPAVFHHLTTLKPCPHTLHTCRSQTWPICPKRTNASQPTREGGQG